MSAAEQGAPEISTAAILVARYGQVPLRLSADVLLPSMTLRELGKLRAGAVLASSSSVADDLLLTMGGAPLCWGRFSTLR